MDITAVFFVSDKLGVKVCLVIAEPRLLAFDPKLCEQSDILLI